MAPKMEKKISFVKKEGDFAFFVTENGEQIRWPANELPDNLAAGEELGLKLVSAKTEEADQSALAAAVLNELLRPAAREN